MVISHSKKAGILFQGLRHDLSKYGPTEFSAGVKFYTGDKSPNEGERRAYGYSKAWLHHKGRNKHHFEYWTDYNTVTHKVTPVPMPKKYIAEMFCDRVAASKIYMGEKYTNTHPLEYFRAGKIKELAHEKTVALLEEWLILLANKGEKEAFLHIKNLK